MMICVLRPFEGPVKAEVVVQPDPEGPALAGVLVKKKEKKCKQTNQKRNNNKDKQTSDRTHLVGEPGRLGGEEGLLEGRVDRGQVGVLHPGDGKIPKKNNRKYF